MSKELRLHNIEFSCRPESKPKQLLLRRRHRPLRNDNEADNCNDLLCAPLVLGILSIVTLCFFFVAHYVAAITKQLRYNLFKQIPQIDASLIDDLLYPHGDR